MQNPNLPPSPAHTLLPFPSTGATPNSGSGPLSLCDPQVEHGPDRFCWACFVPDEEGPDGFDEAYYSQYQDGYTVPSWNE